MKLAITGPILVLISLILTLPSGCGRSGEIPYPFEDGDTFIYRAPTIQGGLTKQARYVVEKNGDGFVVRHFVALQSPDGRGAESQITNVEMAYDRYGRVQKLANGKSAGKCKGNYCVLWIKPELRHVGATFALSEDAREVVVIEEVRRGQRDLLLATVGSRQYYYDKSNGYLIEQTDFGTLSSPL